MTCRFLTGAVKAICGQLLNVIKENAIVVIGLGGKTVILSSRYQIALDVDVNLEARLLHPRCNVFTPLLHTELTKYATTYDNCVGLAVSIHPYNTSSYKFNHTSIYDPIAHTEHTMSIHP